MTSPAFELTTHFVLDRRGRILSTREPRPTRGPLFTLIRSSSATAWAVHAAVPDQLAEQLEERARREPPATDLRTPPVYANEYLSWTRGRLGFTGPAFLIPEDLPPSPGVVSIEDERLLQHNFRAWEPGAISAGRAPVLAVLEHGWPVSICFSSRRTQSAAAAGLETCEAHRGRGYGPLAATAWAAVVRTSGRVPLYSADWNNQPSLAVARKLRMKPHACFWSISE